MKYAKRVATLFCLLFVMLFTDLVSATEKQEDSALSKNMDATFSLKIEVIEGFDEEIQFLFISEDGEQEYDITLNENNAYSSSFVAEGNTTYKMLYYYESYEVYEIEDLKKEYICEIGTKWNLNYSLIQRVNPVEEQLFPLGGDMSITEYESAKMESFKSSIFPDMNDEDIAKWYYCQVKEVVKETKEENLVSITGGIRDEVTKKYFNSNSGTDNEWETISDEKLITFYYSCVLPTVILENNDFDFDDYIKKIDILQMLCKNIGCEKLYDITYKLWEYIWEYQRSERVSPNFATYLITEFRAEDKTANSDIDRKLSDVEKEIEENPNTEKDNIFFRYIKEHWVSILLLFFGGGVLGIYWYKSKKQGKGRIIR